MSDSPAESYDVQELRTQLGRIIGRVQQGHEVIISPAGQPASGEDHAADGAQDGSLAGRIVMAPDWDSPETNADIARDFGI